MAARPEAEGHAGGFNGAALRRARESRLGRQGRQGLHRASMGPHSGERGNAPIRGIAMWWMLLQWGRTPRSAEILGMIRPGVGMGSLQ